MKDLVFYSLMTGFSYIFIALVRGLKAWCLAVFLVDFSIISLPHKIEV